MASTRHLIRGRFLALVIFMFLTLGSRWPAVAQDEIVPLPGQLTHPRGFEYQLQELTPSMAEPNMTFGSAIAVDGDTLMVGASTYKEESGAVFIFQRDSSGFWQETDMLELPDNPSFRYFGQDIALEGDTAIITLSTNGFENGAYVYQRDAGGLWQKTQELKALEVNTIFGIHGAELSLKGDRLAMASLDGRKVLVYERDANQIWQVKASIKLEDVDHGITSSQPVGQPFHRLRLTPPFAVEPLTIAYYSFDSVAIDDDTLMMTYSYSFIGDYRNGLSVYRRDADGVWSEVQHLDPAETGTCALLAPMRLEAGRLFIPGNGIDCRQAGVTVFKETNGDRRWVLDETIVPDNGQPNDAFGHQIALNGSLLAVSSPNANRLDGAVYIFERSGGHWIQQEAITAPAASALNLGNVLAFDNQTLAAAQLPDFSQSGAVYVYDRLTPTSTELLVDAGFELQGAAWDIESPLAKTKCSFDADETIAYEGSCAVQLKGSPLATTRISQVITKGVASGDTLTLGGYVRVKGEVASEVKVTVVYADAQTPKSKLTMVVTSDTGGAYVPLSSLQPALTISVVGVPKKIKVQLTNTSESAKISYDALSLTAASLP